LSIHEKTALLGGLFVARSILSRSPMNSSIEAVHVVSPLFGD